MKVLDWEINSPCEGVIRLYMGTYETMYWEGKGWNEVPYEDHAELVDSKYVKAWLDIFVPYFLIIREPYMLPDYKPMSKREIVDNRVPSVFILPPTEGLYKRDIQVKRAKPIIIAPGDEDTSIAQQLEQRDLKILWTLTWKEYERPGRNKYRP